MADALYACIWKAPFTNPPLLLNTFAPGGGTTGDLTIPLAITPDGATVFGQAMSDTSSQYYACRWNTTTLAITLLEPVSVPGASTPNTKAVACSTNGSVAAGGSDTASTTVQYM